MAVIDLCETFDNIEDWAFGVESKLKQCRSTLLVCTGSCLYTASCSYRCKTGERGSQTLTGTVGCKKLPDWAIPEK